ncbi:MAG: aldehyde dehydrogenase family protein, partial [Magnetovibrio sp.]|nr:aldehyde dehydrogenase family protein [Magnetovibrio sp.]
MNDASDAKLKLERNLKNFIAGEWVDSDDKIEVTNPYTNEVVGTVPRMGLDQVKAAIDSLYEYEPTLTAHERSEILKGTAAEIKSRTDELAYGISLESGMSIKDSTKEVGRGVGLLNVAAEEAKRIMGEQLPSDVDSSGADKIIMAMRFPVGVVSAIVPFNRPMNQVVVKVAPGFAAGNKMIIKPTERTPMSAIRFVEIMLNNGMPPEMISIVTGKSSEIGNELVSSQKIDMVTFTGSTEVGRKLTNMAGIKKLTMELGGNDPLIVLEDADLDKAASLATAGAYSNAGQACRGVKRIIVLDSVADAFAEKLKTATEKIKCGDPFDPDTAIGTVIDENAAIEIEEKLKGAIADGAKVLCGNKREGALFTPTVVDHCKPDSNMVLDETFGPVAPLS